MKERSLISKDRFDILDRFNKHHQKDIDFFISRIEIPYINYRNQMRFDIIFQYQPGIVLDVGCGEGIALQYIKPKIYIGADISFSRLRFATTRYKKNSFIQGDGTYLPFRSEKFDLVFSYGTLHHLTGRKVFLMLKEMRRVCRKGGWVAIIEPNAYNPSSFLLGLIRKHERGILQCKMKLFLRYFKQLGIWDEIRLEYDDTSTIMNLFSYFFKKMRFVKSPYFNKFWMILDSYLKRIIPKNFYTNIIIMARRKD